MKESCTPAEDTGMLCLLQSCLSPSSLPSKVFIPFSPVFWGSRSYSVQYPVSLLLMKQFASLALTTLIPGSQLVAHWCCQSKKITIWATARHRHRQTHTCMQDVFEPSFELELLLLPHLQRLWWARWCKAACRWVRTAQPAPVPAPTQRAIAALWALGC